MTKIKPITPRKLTAREKITLGASKGKRKNVKITLATTSQSK